MASESWTDKVDKTINEVVEPVATFMNDLVFYEVTVPGTGANLPLMVAWLVIAGVLFTAYFGFVQVRYMRTAIRLVRGKYDQKDAPGELSHFQALTSAVSGTVGLGNIAGVAIAVSIGGPGATFWMIACGFVGMATKFTECTLGVKYRTIHPDGTVSGGPMQYLTRGLAERGLPNLGKVLAACSAAMILLFAFFGGNLFQVNQSLEQLTSVTGEENSFFSTSGGSILFGVIFAALIALVLIGGVRAIGRVTSRLVPSMAILYVVACLLVISFNITDVPGALRTIVVEAFNPQGVAGGLLGALIVGFQRAAWSNEAGIGSAPIAHAAVKTKRPATEGLVASLEPFVDTVVICTMTALTVIIAGGPKYEALRDAAIEGREVDGSTSNGISVTSDAFDTALPWFPYLLTVAVLLFAFSTLLTWSYYGLKSWTYMFGNSATSATIYKAVFSVVVISGALLSLDTLVSLSDAALFAAALFNIIGLYLLMPVVKRELRKVLEFVRRRDAGESEEDIERDEAAREESEGTAPPAKAP
ncbi:alanine:cation symporter family protein [Streptomyces sp. AJS327]|uniref:alanine/glycine:cation symporter family protein n=1 Tax=Streptomyces sp. AJS327 TaxID=2545265 RepID=UPI0015DDD458|nr:alanine/glycine:cation symporter family protein [Streptomyces sp. AJS327]MBA0049583.1 alanine:cation symporter family protein [Streptomyces sp. AJS327]